MDISLAQAAASNLKLPQEYFDANGNSANVGVAQTAESSNTSLASVMSQDDSGAVHFVIYELQPVLGSAVLSGFIKDVAWSFELNVLADPLPEAVSVTVGAGELIPK
jgi:hypothetical protein